MGRAFKYLVFMNCFLTVIGISVLIASAYARGQIKNDGWAAVMSQQAATIGIISGLFTLFLCIVGCVGAAARQKRMMCIYLTGLGLIFAFQIGATIAMTNYAHGLSISEVNTPSSSLKSLSDIAINNGAFSIFMKCCSGCPGGGCNNTAPGAYYNGTLPFCSGNVTCTIVQSCSTTTSPKCFVNSPPLQQTLVPPLNIDDRLCLALESIWVNNHYIVGLADSGSCGAGDPSKFLYDLNTFVSYSLDGVAGFFTFVAVLEAFAWIAGIYIICFSKPGKIANEDDEQVFV